MPSISVIVPVYKVEPYLRRCTDSILAQTFEDFDLILVDDGSPDSCGEICEEYAKADSRVHVIHQENGGLSAARNSGIDWTFANSDSQWLAFVDSDDWLHPKFLETLYAAANETGSHLSVCGLYRTEGEGFPEKMDFSVESMTADDYYCSRKIHGGLTAVAWNKLYHKTLFDSMRYPVGKLHEDEFTTYQAVYQAGKVAVISAPLYAYFQNAAGIMQSKWNSRRLHVLEAFEHQIAFAQQNGNSRLLRKAVGLYIFSIHDHLGKAPREYHGVLRKKLRAGLSLGRKCGAFPMCWEKLWAYEEAYPLKPLWWLLFRGKALAERITGKEEKDE